MVFKNMITKIFNEQFILWFLIQQIQKDVPVITTWIRITGAN